MDAAQAAVRHGKRSNRTSPSAHIWMSNDAKIRFFYRPALLTIQAGLLSANLTAQITSWQWSVLEDLGPGDFFAFVGVHGLDPFKRHLKALTSQGVYTVFYSTEADFGHSCSDKQGIHVREVWEYTQSNVLCCKGTYSRRPWRYVPPGYIPRTTLAPSTMVANQLTFIGSANVHYDKRRSCLRKMARGLMPPNPNANVTKAQIAFCEDKVCVPGNCAKMCALRVRSLLYDDTRLDKELNQTASFLNVHKACFANATTSIAACESFRFAPLLSAGAEVFSEHCHPADEAEYSGLIHFAPVDDLSEAVLSSWREGARSSPMQRAEAFKQRFHPRAIFERAGITAALQANAVRWRDRGRHSHSHPWNSNSSGAVVADWRPLSSHAERPAYCKGSK